MEIGICSATAKSDEKNTLLYKSIIEMGIECDLNFVTNNTEHLGKVYNGFLELARNSNWDGLILIHDDVILEHDPTIKLKKLFNEYDVVGVAGPSKVYFQSPALWHLMGTADGSPLHLHGAVAHSWNDKKHMTSFGEYPHRVLMIDGVFMAMNRNYIQNGGGFDEDCPSFFHFYDLLMSHDAHRNGFKVGVGDIYICHASPGLREYSDEWRKGEEYFLKTYGG